MSGIRPCLRQPIASGASSRGAGLSLTTDRRTLERLDPAWAAAALRLEDPLALIGLHETLERRREQVEAGDTLAVLQALETCCRSSMPAPAWLARMFVNKLSTFTACPGALDAPSSLDEVFSSPYLPAGMPKRTRKARRDWFVGNALWQQVRLVAPRHRGLDGALREVLSVKAWPVRRSRARQLVQMIDAAHVHLSSGRIAPLSRLWVKS